MVVNGRRGTDGCGGGGGEGVLGVDVIGVWR